MNSKSILNSNLLDIIFNNRNKSYGAYVLRRDYNKRLLKSLLAVMAFVVICFCLQMFIKKNISGNVYSGKIIPDVSISSPHLIEKRIEVKKIILPKAKYPRALDQKAVIVKNLTEEAAPPNDQMPDLKIAKSTESSTLEFTG
ncbi:MAG: hypothetical protein ABIO55_15105, partial [Ginsengibacter sp.]